MRPTPTVTICLATLTCLRSGAFSALITVEVRAPRMTSTARRSPFFTHATTAALDCSAMCGCHRPGANTVTTTLVRSWSPCSFTDTKLPVPGHCNSKLSYQRHTVSRSSCVRMPDSAVPMRTCAIRLSGPVSTSSQAPMPANNRG
ncbi:hypothetical protein NONI108955_07325 [Nocardia ninae]